MIYHHLYFSNRKDHMVQQAGASAQGQSVES